MKQQQPIVYGGTMLGAVSLLCVLSGPCKHFYNLITNSVSDSFVWSVQCLNLSRMGWIIFLQFWQFTIVSQLAILYLYRPGPRPASLITADCKVAFVNKTCNHLFLQEMSLVTGTRDRLHEKWCSSAAPNPQHDPSSLPWFVSFLHTATVLFVRGLSKDNRIGH